MPALPLMVTLLSLKKLPKVAYGVSKSIFGRAEVMTALAVAEVSTGSATSVKTKFAFSTLLEILCFNWILQFGLGAGMSETLADYRVPHAVVTVAPADSPVRDT